VQYISAKDATDAWANSLEEIDLTEFIGQKNLRKIRRYRSLENVF
jgi:hypothetical protein